MAYGSIEYLISAKDEATRVMTGVANSMGTMGKATSALNKQLLGVGAAGVIAGGLMLKALGSAVDAAREFGGKMNEIWTLMDGTSGKYIKALGDKVLDLSTRVPQSASTLAEGLYWVTSAGFAGAEGLTVLEQAAKLAVAGLTDTGVTTDVLAKTLNAYGLEASKAGQVSDVMFQTVAMGMTRMEDLAPAWTMVAGLAATAGIKVEELGAAFATMTRQGLPVRVAGTAIRATINDLLGPSEGLIQVWGTLSDKTIQVALQQEGLTGVLGKLQGYFGVQTASLKEVAAAAGDDEEQFLALAEAKGLVSTEMKKMFPSSRSLVGMLNLMANGGATYTEMMGKMGSSTGVTERAFAKMTNTLGAKMQILGNVFKVFVIGVGNALIPALKWLADKLKIVADFFSKLPEPVKKFIGIGMAIVGVTLAIGGLIAIIGAIGPAIGAALAGAAAPIGIFIAIMIGVVAVISLIVKYWDKIKPVVTNLWNAIKPILVEWWNKLKEIGQAVWKWLGEAWQKVKGPLLSVLKAVWSAVTQLWKAFVSIWNHIKGPLMGVLKQVWGLFKELWNVLKALWPVIKLVGQVIGVVMVVSLKIVTTWLRVLGWIFGTIIIPIIKVFVAVLRGAAVVVKVVIQAIVAVFRFLWNTVKFVFGLIMAWWKLVAKAFRVAWNAIVAVFRWVWNILVTIWNAVGKPFVSALKIIWDAVYAVWSKIWEVIKSVLEFVWNVISAIFHAIWDVLVAVASVIWDVLVTVWQAVWGTVKTVLLAIWNAIVAVWHAIFGPLKAIAMAIWNALSAAWNAVWGGIKAVVEGVWNALVATWHAIIDPIVNVVSHVWDGIQAVWDSVWGAITGGIKAAINGIIHIINGLIRAWNAVPFHDDVGTIDTLHSGGLVQRTGTYLLQSGEFVLRKAAVDKFGLDTIAELNMMGLIGGAAPVSSAMITGASGGISHVSTSTQSINIETINVYNPSNWDDIQKELDTRANRVNLRTKTSKEEW